MFVEHLLYRVSPERATAFLIHNRRWRAALARQPGFLGQSTYRQADEPALWLVVVVWRDRAAMEAFPRTVQAELEATDQSQSLLERAEMYWEVEE